MADNLSATSKPVQLQLTSVAGASAVTAANPLPVSSTGGLVSTNNSSTATLAGDAVFTGTGDDVTHYSSISITWDADVASANNGLSRQFSTDNTNWDRKIPVETHNDALAVNHGGVHVLRTIAKYFRVVYTNGSTIQAHFRLQVLYHTDSSLGLVSRIEQQLNTSSDCTLVRPVTNIDLDLARKNITGQRAFFFFGFNADIDNAWEDVHAAGGDINWPTTAAKVKVASSNAADTSAGIGVRSVEIHGLSATGADQDEVIVMNGTTAVESALTYIRVNKMHSETCGTYGGSHEGDIECRVTNATFANGDLLATMSGSEGAVDVSVQYGRGEAGRGAWSVPLGKVMYITRIGVAMGKVGSQTIDIALYEREDLLTTSAPYAPRRVLWEVAEIDTPHLKDFTSHIKIKALADVWFRAKGSGSNNKIEVSCDFYLVDANAAGA